VVTDTKIIDGKAIAVDIKSELKANIETELAAGARRAPGLAVIIVGNDAASHYYVRSKQKSCDEVGIANFKSELPADTSKADLIELINNYNQNPEVDAILLQLPLPDGLAVDTQEILDTISPEKDVDGLTTINLGRVFNFDKTAILPCTPKGCMELLKRTGVECSGKKALVIGRSNLVGKPIAMMLNQANATVTMAHSRTTNLEAEVAAADILIVAIGRPEFIKGSWIKTGSIVIDVGINAVEVDATRKLVGDVEYEAAAQRAAAITPVPGGVGPMTVAMLLSNTLELYKRHMS